MSTGNLLINAENGYRLLNSFTSTPFRRICIEAESLKHDDLKKFLLTMSVRKLYCGVLVFRDVNGISPIIEHLIQYTQQNEHLTELVISGINILREDRILIFKGLYGNQTLKGLAIRNYVLVNGEEYVKEVESLVSNTNLFQVDLEMEDWRPLAVSIYRELLRRYIQQDCEIIQNLSSRIKGYFISDVISHISTYKTNTVEELAIHRHIVTSTDENYNSDLKKLVRLLIELDNPLRYIFFNRISNTSDNIDWMIEIIDHSKGLNEFIITESEMKIEDIKRVVEALIHSSSRSTIDTVGLCFNKINPVERVEICVELIMKTSVMELRDWDIGMTDIPFLRVKDAINTPIEERFIEIECNTKSAAKR